MTKEDKVFKHWPVILTVAIVAAVFILSMISFQVKATELAVVKRFGKPVRVMNSGWKWKWPYPVESVWTVDRRIQCFEGNTGVVEEVFTRDGQNLIITTYICWRVSEAEQVQFLEKVGNLKQAKEELTALLRSHRNGIIGKYAFNELVNVDADKLKLARIEADMCKAIRADAMRLYGIEVTAVGIKHIGFPESVTTKVFERMKAEREAIAQNILSQGDADATAIKAEAEKQKQDTLSDAEKRAKEIRAEGDAVAAEFYATFKQNPELASFLRRLDSLEKIMADKKTTLVLDNRTPPFNLLRENVLEKITAARKKPTK